MLWQFSNMIISSYRPSIAICMLYISYTELLDICKINIQSVIGIDKNIIGIDRTQNSHIGTPLFLTSLFGEKLLNLEE